MVFHVRNYSATLKAKLRLRERQLFGKKSEKRRGRRKGGQKTSNRPRGQQKQNKIPPRRSYSHLPITIESRDIPEKQRLCPCCGAPYLDVGATEESEILEIHIKAHRRCIRRKKYRRSCICQSEPILITASKASKILSKSRLGDSIWSYCLIQKFWHGQPLHREREIFVVYRGKRPCAKWNVARALQDTIFAPPLDF